MREDLKDSFAKVYIDSASAASDKIYEYSIPEALSNLIKPAMRVIVPFGKNDKLSQAFVVSVSGVSEFDPLRLKPIISLADASPVLPAYLAQTIVFLRNNYFCSYGEALRCVLPAADKLKKRTRYFAVDNPEEGEKALENEDERALLKALTGSYGREAAYIRSKTGLTGERILTAAAALEQRGLIKITEEFTAEGREAFDEYISLTSPDNSPADHYAVLGKRAARQRAVIDYLFEKGKSVPKKELMEATKASFAALKSLTENNLITISLTPRVYAKSTYNASQDDISPLTEQQREALEVFRSLPIGEKFLLFGVTGSGKTRLFFEMFEDMLKQGKQCLLLVPEISLTPQMMALVEGRFGQSAAIMHSALSPSRRYSEFLKIKRGQARIVLGARSALFMPFSELGMIVVDEQHETSYKSSSSPRYDTIETAKFIAAATGATLLLSSATPDTAAYHAALNGEYTLLRLTKRVNDIPMPPVDIVDMKEELKGGNRSPISEPLRLAIEQTLEKKQQVLLFLNRRGFNTYVFCRQCGYIEMCPNCEVSLTYHSKEGRLRCHYCGYEKAPERICPSCGSDKIRFMGTGTEKIEQAIRELFPEAGILRLDSDTAGFAGAHERILGQFASGGADILIGTQMIVKGLDFDNVTLVGILLADSSLNFPDINAASRTFQLTAQASGRAGRRLKGGRVILQTYLPGNPVILYAASHDYPGFYAYDIAYRKERNYPPFTEIIGFFITGENKDKLLKEAAMMQERIEKLCDNTPGVTVYDVAPAFIQKIKNRYIYHILVRLPAQSPLKATLREKYDDIRKKVSSYTYVEINPITLL